MSQTSGKKLASRDKGKGYCIHSMSRHEEPELAFRDSSEWQRQRRRRCFIHY
jgi:hypothetical protein